MGQTNSRASLTQLSYGYSEDLYIPIPNNKKNSQIQALNINPFQNESRQILKTDFAGIWSVHHPSCFSPSPRTGHFTAYSSQYNIAFIGYGVSFKGEILSDLWAFHTIEKTWKEIPLTGDKVSPRSGSNADIFNNILVIFGGYCQPNYFSDLHVIDVTTGVRTIVQTNGIQPSPRSTPIVKVYNQKVYIWGGFNGEYPNKISVLDMQSRTWSHYSQDIDGRTAAPSVLIGSELYCYGGHKSSGLVVIDLNQNVIKMVPTTGTEPIPSVLGAGMVKADRYLFFFGGKGSSEWALMYAHDIERRWWFIFHLIPDGRSVNIRDGIFSDIGLFMVPRIHFFSMVYEDQKREIIAFLGQPEKNPPPVVIISIGEALGSLHLREDMLQMLKYY